MRSTRNSRLRNALDQEMRQWESVTTTLFKESDRAAYGKREQALRMYADGVSFSEIELRTGIAKQTVYRFVERCMTLGADGNPMGFLALVRYRHVISRSNANLSLLEGHTAKANSLGTLFLKFPLIRRALFDYAIYGKREGLKNPEINAPISAIQQFFEELCEQAGITAPHYPFNCESAGRHAIRRWVNRERTANAIAYIAVSDPDAAVSMNSSGSFLNSICPVTRYYQRVQCDAHRIDYQCRIEVPSDDGEGVIYRKIDRIWIIVLIEVKSSAVIGYTFSYNKNYTAHDIMRAVRCSMRPWSRRKLSVTTLDYGEGEGLPSGVIEELAYTRFDELSIDNAKAHLSPLFLDCLERMAGAVPVFIPTGSPNANAIVEGFFRILEESGLHRMPGTTGSDADDPRAKQQNINLDHILTLDQLSDLIDLLIAKINGTRTSKSSLTKIEVLKRAVTRRSCIFRRIPVHARESLLRYDHWEIKTIGKEHNRPCVRFQGDTYSNDLLKSAGLLVGRTVLIMANSEDLRTVECVLDDGTHLGTLISSLQWRSTPHSVRTRQEINRLRGQGLRLPGKDTPVEFRRHLELEAKKSKKAANKLARVRAEQDNPLFENPEAEEINLENPVEQYSELAKEAPKSNHEDYDTAMEETEKLLANIRTVYR